MNHKCQKQTNKNGKSENTRDMVRIILKKNPEQRTLSQQNQEEKIYGKCHKIRDPAEIITNDEVKEVVKLIKTGKKGG